jgi:hypothetical protein
MDLHWRGGFFDRGHIASLYRGVRLRWPVLGCAAREEKLGFLRGKRGFIFYFLGWREVRGGCRRAQQDAGGVRGAVIRRLISHVQAECFYRQDAKVAKRIVLLFWRSWREGVRKNPAVAVSDGCAYGGRD